MILEKYYVGLYVDQKQLPMAIIGLSRLPDNNNGRSSVKEDMVQQKALIKIHKQN